MTIPTVNASSVDFELDGAPVSVVAGGSLLDALREQLGVRSAKDGCSPQGQCGCCTVWVDGRPRVACVTPVNRVAGRRITTIDGLTDADRWAEAFTECGASQCGFCTPGIIMRLAALDPEVLADGDQVSAALKAHLCRCTGWATVVEAAVSVAGRPGRGGSPTAAVTSRRARARAVVEGGSPQRLGPEVALGRGGFADDLAPPDALVALRAVAGPHAGEWVVAETLDEARRLSGKVQGRRTTAPLSWPVDLADGTWERTLRTTWVEPAYLEPDAAWAEPGGEVRGPLGNGGAFGAKLESEVVEVAQRLADRYGRAVRVLSTREDVVRHGPKRPPMSIGLRADGGGVVRVVRTPGIVERIRLVADEQVEVIEVDVDGPPTSASLRGAGWTELAIVRAALGQVDTVTTPDGASATASIDDDGAVHVSVSCGADPADASELTVLRSYCLGAAHMALGWVRSEAIAVDDAGVPIDLTVRSFGVLRAVDTPPVHLEIDTSRPPSPDDRLVAGSDAVVAAVAAAAWRRAGYPPTWPHDRDALR